MNIHFLANVIYSDKSTVCRIYYFDNSYRKLCNVINVLIMVFLPIFTQMLPQEKRVYSVNVVIIV